MRPLYAPMLALLLALTTGAGAQTMQEPYRCIYPEQRTIEYRPPAEIWRLPDPTALPPRTVATSTDCNGQQFLISLDEAIAVALSNAEVIRVLAGNTAVSSGLTVYDPAIQNTQVDVARALFDPQFSSGTTYNHGESFLPRPDAGQPSGVFIDKIETESLNATAGISQTKVSGTTYQANVTTNPSNSNLGGQLLDPSTPTALNFGVTKPLLQGGNPRANVAPIVIARISTEQSFYQLKDAVQELVRGVVEGYWNIVAARVDVWARRQQVDQLEFASNFFEAQLRVGRADLGDAAQARVSLANFRANLIAAEAELLNREAAFRNLLGLDPVDEFCLIPSTPPLKDQQRFEWQQLLATAEQFRPEVIQIKLQIDADRQRLLVAHNNALPQVNAVANQTLNGLGGTGPTGVTTGAFGAPNVRVGLDVALPLGLRSSRAQLRQAELTLARDRANLRQQLHFLTHNVAQTLRNQEQLFRQYEAFRIVREAAKINLDRQFAVFRVGGTPTDRINYLQVLLAVTDWGNAVSNEANSLTRYNVELANLQRQIGTIIEDHGITFYEDRYLSLGVLRKCKDYPEAIWTGENQPVYPVGDEAADQSFDLQSNVPKPGGTKTNRVPPRAAIPPTLPDPMRLLDKKPRDSDVVTPPPAQRPDRSPGAAPVQPAAPPAEQPPAARGRLPGDDIKEFMDRLQERLSPKQAEPSPPN